MDHPQTSKLELTDQESFSNLFEQTHLFVYRYVYGLTGGPKEEVDDLVAETYSRAWAARGRFRGNAEDAVHWLLKISRHQVIDAYRRRKTKGVPLSLEETDPPTMEGDPETRTITKEKRQVVWRMLQSLNEDNKEILVLRYILEWPVQKIATYLGKKETAISMSIHRSLHQLEASLPPSEFPWEERSYPHA